MVKVHYRPTAADQQTVYRLNGDCRSSVFNRRCKRQTRSNRSPSAAGTRRKTKIEETVERTKVKGVVHPVDLGVDETGLLQKEEIVADHPIQSGPRPGNWPSACPLAQGIAGRGKTVGLPSLRAGTKIFRWKVWERGFPAFNRRPLT